MAAAHAHWRAAINQNPSSELPVFFLALAEMESGKLDDARRHMNEVFQRSDSPYIQDLAKTFLTAEAKAPAAPCHASPSRRSRARSSSSTS